MKTVFSNAQCAHVWAAQSQLEGRGSNLAFEGATIYSYGRHWPIASFQRDIVLFNYESYGNSTAKHHNHVRAALRGLPIDVISVPKMCVTGANQEGAMASFQKRRGAALESAAKARTHTDMHLESAARIEAAAQRYALAFGLPAPVLAPYDRTVLLAKAKAQAAERERKRAIEAARREAIYPLVLEAWRRGETYAPNGVYYSLSGYRDKPTALRLSRDGASVETSRGAEVPIRDAKRLWQMIALAKVNGSELAPLTSGSYPNVGAFTLRSIGADGTAVIGCHTLEYQETGAFARSQGWIK